MKKSVVYIFLSGLLLLMLSWSSQPPRSVIYLIGDSTMEAVTGGWGQFLPRFFDTTQISIRNYAQAGSSARTFMTGGLWSKTINTRGMWDTVSVKMKKGDYLIVQFGLNDQGPIVDSARARGTLKGIGNDSLVIFNPVTRRPETVRSFGWYLRSLISQARAKGVAVIICSTVPTARWKDNKIIRGELGFAGWALDVAREEGVFSLDLNTLVADRFDQEGPEAVAKKYHRIKDLVHTTPEGALLNASLVAQGIRTIVGCDLKEYMQPVKK